MAQRQRVGSAVPDAGRRSSREGVLIVSGGGPAGGYLAAALGSASTVATPAEALPQLLEHAPQVLVLDLAGSDGDELALVRRARGLDMDMVIILLSERVSERDHLAAFTAGADACLSQREEREHVVPMVRDLRRLDGDARRHRRAQELDRTQLLLRLEQQAANG